MKNLGRRNIKQHFINTRAVMYSRSEFVPTRWEFWRVFQSWLRRTAMYRVGQRWHSGCGNARVLSQRGCGRKYVHGAVWLFAMHLPDSCFFFNLFVFRILSLPLFPFLRGKPREGKYRTMYATIFWKADNSCKYPAQFFLSSFFLFLRRMALPPDDAKFFLPPARPLHIDSLTLAVWQPPPSFLRRLYSL